jgi:hypothetical protein
MVPPFLAPSLRFSFFFSLSLPLSFSLSSFSISPLCRHLTYTSSNRRRGNGMLQNETNSTRPTERRSPPQCRRVCRRSTYLWPTRNASSTSSTARPSLSSVDWMKMEAPSNQPQPHQLSLSPRKSKWFTQHSLLPSKSRRLSTAHHRRPLKPNPRHRHLCRRLHLRMSNCLKRQTGSRRLWYTIDVSVGWSVSYGVVCACVRACVWYVCGCLFVFSHRERPLVH